MLINCPQHGTRRLAAAARPLRADGVTIITLCLVQMASKDARDAMHCEMEALANVERLMEVGELGPL